MEPQRKHQVQKLCEIKHRFEDYVPSCLLLDYLSGTWICTGSVDNLSMLSLTFWKIVRLSTSSNKCLKCDQFQDHYSFLSSDSRSKSIIKVCFHEVKVHHTCSCRNQSGPGPEQQSQSPFEDSHSNLKEQFVRFGNNFSFQSFEFWSKLPRSSVLHQCWRHQL